jgi:hypothetical protein
MSDRKITINFGAFWWVMFWLVLIVLFWGDPDLHDALVKWAMK